MVSVQCADFSIQLRIQVRQQHIGKKTKTIPKSCSKTRTKDKTHRNYETITKTKVRSVVSSLCSDPLSSSRNWHRQHFRDYPDFQHNGWVWDNFDTASISCSPESTTSPAELTKRFGQTMKHAGSLYMYIIHSTFLMYKFLKMHIIHFHMSLICKAFFNLSYFPCVCNHHVEYCSGVAVSVTTFTDVIAFLVGGPLSSSTQLSYVIKLTCVNKWPLVTFQTQTF